MIRGLTLADADNIEFECQECNATISVNSKKSGQRVICPECVRAVVVPESTVASNLFEDIFDEETSELKLSPIEDDDPDHSTPESQPTLAAPHSETGDGESNGLELDDEETLDESLQPAADVQLEKLSTEEESDPIALLKIDGLGGLYGGDSAHSVTCRICDSLIHIEADKIGSTIECPECFTKIPIDPLSERKIQKPIWQQPTTPQADKSSIEVADDDELKLSDPIEKPKIEIDPSYGLDGPSEDLLAPKRPPAPEQLSDELTLEPEYPTDQPTAPSVTSNKPSAPSPQTNAEQKNKSELPPIKTGRELAPQSRRERLEKAQQKQRSAEQGTVFSHRENSADPDSQDFPATDLGAQFKSAIAMLLARNTVWRFALAILLMCGGAVAMESISPSYASPDTNENSTAFEKFFNFVTWLLMGGLPYLLGWLMLLYTSAYIFRDAALGCRTVNSWKNKGLNELTSTVLVFGFSFLAAGIIMLFLPVLILPMQLLVAPLFLTSVWYSRSPFNVVNIDAFQTGTEAIQLWKSLYQLIAILVIAAIFSGLLLFIRGFEFMPPFLNLALTIPAVFFKGLITTIFAATCGWHCGRVSIEPV